jgi:hypothetical protein
MEPIFLPESRVVKVDADLLAFEPLPIYIAITTSSTNRACVKRLEFGKRT